MDLIQRKQMVLFTGISLHNLTKLRKILNNPTGLEHHQSAPHNSLITYYILAFPTFRTVLIKNRMTKNSKNDQNSSLIAII